MTITIETLIAEFPDLDAAEVTSWVERHWVIPDLDDYEHWVFTEIDVARVRLIHDLRRDLEIAEDTVPLMLSLLDQVYDLRCTLRAVNRAVALQPPEVQDAIRAALSAQDLIGRLDRRRT
jgi:chaperone modulatory protein CbpM